MFIRFFARTDESELGRASAAYCDHLVATGLPVRLVAAKVAELQVDARGRGGGIWNRHRGLLITPMDGAFINAVCGEPWDWGNFHTPSAHRNVILLADENLGAAVPQPVLLAAVQQYDAIYALTDEVAETFERVTGTRPHVAPAGMIWTT